MTSPHALLWIAVVIMLIVLGLGLTITYWWNLSGDEVVDRRTRNADFFRPRGETVVGDEDAF